MGKGESLEKFCLRKVSPAAWREASPFPSELENSNQILLLVRPLAGEGWGESVEVLLAPLIRRNNLAQEWMLRSVTEATSQ